jgi:hypothetical protein
MFNNCLDGFFFFFFFFRVWRVVAFSEKIELQLQFNSTGRLFFFCPKSVGSGNDDVLRKAWGETFSDVMGLELRE